MVNFGEVQRAQLAKSTFQSPRLHVEAPEIFSDLLRSVQMLKRLGCYRTYLSLLKLQPWFLSLQQKTCPWEQNSDDDDDDDTVNNDLFLGFTTLFLTPQVIRVASDIERENSDKFCSEALISA